LLDPSQRHDSCMKHASCGLQNQEGSHSQRDSLAACLGGNIPDVLGYHISVFFFLLHIATMRNTYCVVFFIITGCQRDSKSHNPKCPREHGNPSGHHAHARNFPRPSIQVQFFSGMGTGGPKKPQGCPCRSLLHIHGL